MKSIIVQSIAALLIAAPAVVLAAPNIQDGLWEITSRTEMPGMPKAMPPVKYTTCLNQKDAVPQAQEKNQQCRITSSNVQGDTVSWSMECRDKDQVVRSSGKVTYAGNSFSGSNLTTVEQPGEGKVQITSQMSGKRIGDCKK